MTFPTISGLILIVCVLPAVVSIPILRTRGVSTQFPSWTIYLAMSGAIVVTGISAAEGALSGNYWLLLPWIALVALAITSFSLLRITRSSELNEVDAEEAAVNARTRLVSLHLRLMLTFGAIAATSGFIIMMIAPMSVGIGRLD